MDREFIAQLRRASLYSFVIFLCGSALVLIVAVLSGSFGDFEVKVLLTALVVTVLSIGIFCCAAYIQARDFPLPGYGGIILVIVAAAMVTVGIWNNSIGDDYWKTTAVFSIFAVFSSQFLILLTAQLDFSLRWVFIVTGLSIYILATTVSYVIYSEADDESLIKAIAVLAILVALETLVIPILHRIGKSRSRPELKEVILYRRDDGTYLGKDGRSYELTELNRRQ